MLKDVEKVKEELADVLSYAFLLAEKYNFDVKELGIEWNRTPTRDEDYPCNFAHYTGNNKKKIIELYG